ncbi:MAG: hypothetical protein K0R84_424, partial [Clostridia bacterium]|nr:hypothetical protein [Clostridia bacterium]
MGRSWREEYKGGIYHVIARGNNKEFIFKEDIDKGYFIKQVKETVKGMGYQVFGFVLMDNHYHIIIQTLDKKLQVVMHQINNTYSKYFNSKYNRVGHVFQGRYKAILVQDERYLIGLLRYVHQNPVQANICTKVEDYKWSSDIFFRKSMNSFVNIDIVLEMLDGDRKAAINKYKQLMLEREERDYEKLKVVGDEAFQLMCSSKKKNIERKRLDELLIDTGISIEDYALV